MRTKLVYCLVSDDGDIFLEEALLSIYSAKYYNPAVQIELIVDNKTKENMKFGRENILKYVDKFHVITVDNTYTNKQKSRILKLSVRDIVKGDSLYIDTDTVILGNLNGLDKINAEVAAVPDLHFTKEDFPFYRNEIKDKLRAVNCDINIHMYYNGGVIFSKDTLNAYNFYHKWKENYLKNLPSGIDYDQGNLALTDWEMGNVIKNLPDIYNCQIREAYIQGAKILHYYNVAFGGYGISSIPFLNESFYLEIKKNRDITEYAKKIVADPFSTFPKFAAIPLIDWHETPSFIILDKWKRSSNLILQSEFRTAQFLLKFVDQFQRYVKKCTKKIFA